MNSNKVHVCTQDGRRFATKPALQQHVRDAHSAGARGRGGRGARGAGRGGRGGRGGAANAPVAKATAFGMQGGSGARASSVDVLAVSTVDVKKASVGTVLAHLVINPRAFEGTRMAQMATLWSRWRPIKMDFTIQTTLPTIAGGQITAAWAADDTEMLPAAMVPMIRKLGTLRPCVMAHGWEILRLSVSMEAVQRWLYTDMRQDDSRHGVLWVVMTGKPTDSVGTFQTTVQCSWTLEFEAPDMPVAAEHEDIVADDGYYPYYTTGSVHLPITDRLTAEESSAGGYATIVRYSSAQLDTVYIPQSDVIYIASNAQKKVKAAVRMKEVADPFFWFFETTDKAANYIKTGDVSNIIKYEASGPWTNPANPIYRKSSSLSIAYSNMDGSKFVVANTSYIPSVKDDTARRGVDKLRDDIKAIAKTRPVGTLSDPVKVLVVDPGEGSECSSFGGLSLDDQMPNL